ncbi:MAG: hypothetical protein HAW67_06670 [Endozoicomonadaceae bacterium]|nr:hypothetical protein [Endozoicomonadaceae bacterium]
MRDYIYKLKTIGSQQVMFVDYPISIIKSCIRLVAIECQAEAFYAVKVVLASADPQLQTTSSKNTFLACKSIQSYEKLQLYINEHSASRHISNSSLVDVLKGNVDVFVFFETDPLILLELNVITSKIDSSVERVREETERPITCKCIVVEDTFFHGGEGERVHGLRHKEDGYDDFIIKKTRTKLTDLEISCFTKFEGENSNRNNGGSEGLFLNEVKAKASNWLVKNGQTRLKKDYEERVSFEVELLSDNEAITRLLQNDYCYPRQKLESETSYNHFQNYSIICLILGLSTVNPVNNKINQNMAFQGYFTSLNLPLLQRPEVVISERHLDIACKAYSMTAESKKLVINRMVHLGGRNNAYLNEPTVKLIENTALRIALSDPTTSLTNSTYVAGTPEIQHIEQEWRFWSELELEMYRSDQKQNYNASSVLASCHLSSFLPICIDLDNRMLMTHFLNQEANLNAKYNACKWFLSYLKFDAELANKISDCPVFNSEVVIDAFQLITYESVDWRSMYNQTNFAKVMLVRLQKIYDFDQMKSCTVDEIDIYFKKYIYLTSSGYITNASQVVYIIGKILSLDEIETWNLRKDTEQKNYVRHGFNEKYKSRVIDVLSTKLICEGSEIKCKFFYFLMTKAIELEFIHNELLGVMRSGVGVASVKIKTRITRWLGFYIKENKLDYVITALNLEQDQKKLLLMKRELGDVLQSADINLSGLLFEFDRAKIVERFTLTGIDNDFIEILIEERKKSLYGSVFDVVSRLKKIGVEDLDCKLHWLFNNQLLNKLLGVNNAEGVDKLQLENVLSTMAKSDLTDAYSSNGLCHKQFMSDGIGGMLAYSMLFNSRKKNESLLALHITNKAIKKQMLGNNIRKESNIETMVDIKYQHFLHNIGKGNFID